MTTTRLAEGLRLWPRSLLWRSFTLIVLLIGLSLFAWYQIYSQFAMRPRARQTAQFVVSIVNLTRSALLASDIKQRRALLHELSSSEGIRIYPAEESDPLMPFADTSLVQALHEELRQRIGPYTKLTSRLGSQRGFFVSFRIDPDDADDEFWVMLPPERIARTGIAEWLGWGIAAALLSLIGAYLLVLGIARPLKRLENAARSVGRGEIPPHLPERGSREIAAVAQAFNQMSQDLAELDSDRALILAGISHDLRTPLARLRLGIELSASSADDVAAMSEDIEEMDRIINQFLDFARDAQAESTDQLLVAELVEQIAGAYQRRNHSLHTHIPEALRNIELSVRPMALRRAITNLIDNALRYAWPNEALDLCVERHAQHLVIELADRGPGIPAHEVERLKRPFTRLDAARSNAQGSGLGLAIVERIMRMHGGRLELLARDGGGLRAQLHLPL